MTANFPAHICSHLATACSPGCFSRRVWSVLAEESLLFPKHAYHFVLDNDGNFRRFFFFFFFHLEANMRKPAFAGSIVLVFLCAESRKTDKVSPKYCWLCRCWTWESWVGEGGGLISEPNKSCRSNKVPADTWENVFWCRTNNKILSITNNFPNM